MTGQTCTWRIARLQKSLAQRLRDPALVVEPYREGIDSWVDIVRRPDFTDAVVRSAKVEQRMTRYDGLVKYGQIIEKEVVVSRLLRQNDLPTPRVIAWHRTTEPDTEPSWMLIAFVPHVITATLSRECQRDLGNLARRIHAIELSGNDLTRLASPANWHDWIRQRLLTRIIAAQRYMSTPDPEYLERIFDAALATRRGCHRSLLHLDLRESNLAISDNRIIAIFDLANAIVGDPYLELGRIRGCGLLSPEFLNGYGETEHSLERYGPAVDAYELDLTALLVVVSREEIDDARLHHQMVERTSTLLAQLGAQGV